MKTLWYTKGIPTCIALTLLVGLINFIRAGQDIGRPFGGYLAHFHPVFNVWMADRSTPGWWPLMRSPNRLHPDEDILLQLGGMPYDFDQDERFAEAYSRRPNATIQLVVSKEGKIQTMDVAVIPYTLAHFVDVNLPNLLIGFCFWLVAVVVYRAQLTNSLNRFLALYCCLLAGYIWLNHIGVFWQEGITAKFLDVIHFSIFYLLACGATLHFALLFPRPVTWYRPLVILAIYSVTVICTLAHATSRLLYWQHGWSPWVGWLDKRAIYIASLLGVVGAITLMIRLLWTLINKSHPSRQRRQAGLIFLGIIIAAGWLIPGWAFVFGQTGIPLFRDNVDTRYFLLAIPLFLAMANLRYQAFRSQSQLLLLIPILLISAFFANLSVLLFDWTPAELQLYSRNFTAFVPAFAVAVITSVIWSTQSSWRSFLGRLFHWEQRSYEAVKRFGQQLAGQTSLTKLPGLIVDALVKELELEQAAVYLYHPEENAFRLAGQAGQWGQALPQQLAVPVGQLAEANQLSRLNTPGFTVPIWLAGISTPAEVAIVLQASAKIVGLLILGKRWDEEIIDERDIAILELIGQQAALFLLTAMQIDELRRVPHLVDEAQERERTKIAQELHDTIQQFLGRLPFFLEVSRTNDELRDQILHQCIADIDDAARTLRQIRNNLTTNQVENSLIRPLSHLVSRFQQQTGIATHLEVAPQLDSLLNLNARHALYRVVQQALDNIVEHAKANHVTVQLEYQNGWVAFHIQDDGRGSSETERLQAQDRGSFGLKSMSARIKNLGGDFTFISFPDEGTQVEGWLPVSR